jgi:hypothetical protein
MHVAQSFGEWWVLPDTFPDCRRDFADVGNGFRCQRLKDMAVCYHHRYAVDFIDDQERVNG